MSNRDLYVWGGGHVAGLITPHFKNSSSSPFDNVTVVSRSSPNKYLGPLNIEGSTVLITRPFSQWTEERQEILPRKELEALGKVARVVMVSSTGVYLNSPDKVSEKSQVNSGHPYILAEKDLSQYCDSLTVLRAAGLYDTERGPHLYYKKSGAVSGAASDLLNLIHYNDLAKVIQRTLEDIEIDGLFNVSDNAPLTKAEIHEHLISLGNEWAALKAPKEDCPESSSQNSKRVDSSLIWQRLKLKPLFPDFLHYPGS